MARILQASALALFPCKPNTKIPATKNGFKDAKMDFDAKSYLEKGYNIGLACSQSGLIVLDADVDEKRGLNGLATIKEFETQLGTLPKTLTVQTPRNGKHFTFSSRGIDNPVGKIGKDIDVKFNGYVIFPPSKIDGKSYKIVDGIDENGNFIIADLPDKWLEYINKCPQVNKSYQDNNKSSNKKESVDKFQNLFDECPFIRHCVNNAVSLSEPEWFNFAACLNHLENGEELFDRYSKPHSGYDKDLVKKKYQNASNYNVSCKAIGQVFSGCKICKNFGKQPVVTSKRNLSDLFNEYEQEINSLTFISNLTLDYDANKYDISSQDLFLHQQFDKTFLIKKNKNKLRVTLIANFTVLEVKECTQIYNDKSGKGNVKFYIVTLKNANGRIEKDVIVAGNSKSDYKQFQADINALLNDFSINMAEATFKTFVAQYISPAVAENLTLYVNAGLIDNNTFIYENALVTPEGINWADEDGYIKTGKNTSVKIMEATHCLPKLLKSEKSGRQVANELITNIKECWSENIALPMLVLGHMVMALYYNEFIKRYGTPTLILFGDTGTGKSTLVTVGLAIFGLSKEAMTSGGSTAKSNEYFCAKYNCCNVAIDDVKAETLMSSNFTTLIKNIYKGISRTKMSPYGRGVEYIHTCSPLAYSTNEALPDLKEVINRLNVVEIFGKVFKADKFNYHELNKKNLDELSLILPEFLKYPNENVINLYENVFEKLEKQVEDTQKRIINNLAYAYTGALLLKLIGGIEIKDLDQKVIEFAKNQVERYENIQTPVDRVLSEILILNRLGVIQYDTHFRVMSAEYNGVKEQHLRFNQNIILNLINRYYASDRNKIIHENSFLSYARNHKRFRDDNHGVRYGSAKKVMSSLCFDVTDIEEFANLNLGTYNSL